VSDILDNILKAIPEPAPADATVPPVQATEQGKKTPSMAYSPEFEKQYGKKA